VENNYKYKKDGEHNLMTSPSKKAVVLSIPVNICINKLKGVQN